MCICACAQVCDYRKFRECKNTNTRAEGSQPEFIIGCITALTSESVVSEGRDCFHMFRVSVSEHLVEIGTVPNLQRPSECLNSQWKEVGREREREREQRERRET